MQWEGFYHKVVGIPSLFYYEFNKKILYWYDKPKFLEYFSGILHNMLLSLLEISICLKSFIKISCEG